MYSRDFTMDKSITVKQPKLNMTQIEEQQHTNMLNRAILKDMTGHDDQSTLKFLVYALKENELLLRISNMEDKFDINDSNKQMTRNYTVDLKQFAQKLFETANGLDIHNNNPDDIKFVIEETTLTGVTNRNKRSSEDTDW